MRTNLLKSFARQIVECKKSFKEVQEERTRAKGTAEDLSLFWSDIKLVKNSQFPHIYDCVELLHCLRDLTDVIFVTGVKFHILVGTFFGILGNY